MFLAARRGEVFAVACLANTPPRNCPGDRRRNGPKKAAIPPPSASRQRRATHALRRQNVGLAKPLILRTEDVADARGGEVAKLAIPRGAPFGNLDGPEPTPDSLERVVADRRRRYFGRRNRAAAVLERSFVRALNSTVLVREPKQVMEVGMRQPGM